MLAMVAIRFDQEPGLSWQDYDRYLTEKGLPALSDIENDPSTRARDYQKLLSSVLTDLWDRLRPIERRLAEYACVMPNDGIVQVVAAHVDHR